MGSLAAPDPTLSILCCKPSAIAIPTRWSLKVVTEGAIGIRFWLALVGDEARSVAREQCAALGQAAATLEAYQRRLAAYTWVLASNTDLLSGVSVYLASCSR
jgi:hypothetical protein